MSARERRKPIFPAADIPAENPRAGEPRAGAPKTPPERFRAGTSRFRFFLFLRGNAE